MLKIVVTVYIIRVVHIIHRCIHRMQVENPCQIKANSVFIKKSPQVCTNLWRFHLFT